MSDRFGMSAVHRPDEDILDATPSEVREYIDGLERRMDQYRRIATLLMDMDVFPDMLASIERIAKEDMPSAPQADTLLVGDTQYDLTKAYRTGAVACRSGLPASFNPCAESSQDYDDWSHGHDNEAAGLHQVDGVDVVTATPTGREFVAPETTEETPEP